MKKHPRQTVRKPSRSVILSEAKNLKGQLKERFFVVLLLRMTHKPTFWTVSRAPKFLLTLLVLLTLALTLTACSQPTDLSGLADLADAAEQALDYMEDAPDAEGAEPPAEAPPAIDENGSYTSKDEVALYIHTYGRLPDNFITKSEARKAGWQGGSLESYFPGCCIGGDSFGNREGLLPVGRSYAECDIDTLGQDDRGPKRLVFSSDGLIYYTEDHYASFELLYGEE